MTIRKFADICGLVWFAGVLGISALAAETTQPKPIPATRPEMKQALEALKQRKPRLPLPEPAEGQPSVNNGRARALYLPRAWYASDFQNDSAMTLDYAFKVRLFWIVSRGNNCQYCLGHQEAKLRTAGLAEDDIAALDSDWAAYDARNQAAFGLARKLTLMPHTVQDADIDNLKPHFSDREILEMIYAIAVFNSVNRWTDSLGLPQDQAFRQEPIRFDAPTSPKYATAKTCVAPSALDPRPALEDRQMVLAQMEKSRSRLPRVTLPKAEEVRPVVEQVWTEERLPDWVRALAAFPVAGIGHIRALQAIQNSEDLSPKLKAELSWITARHNRAWYALGQARERLLRLGHSDDTVFALDDSSGQGNPAEAQAWAFARKLTVEPQAIGDDDIAALRRHYRDDEVAKIVYVVCSANMFDRLTETLALANP